MTVTVKVTIIFRTLSGTARMYDIVGVILSISACTLYTDYIIWLLKFHTRSYDKGHGVQLCNCISVHDAHGILHRIEDYKLFTLFHYMTEIIYMENYRSKNLTDKKTTGKEYRKARLKWPYGAVNLYKYSTRTASICVIVMKYITCNYAIDTLTNGSRYILLFHV